MASIAVTLIFIFRILFPEVFLLITFTILANLLILFEDLTTND